MAESLPVEGLAEGYVAVTEETEEFIIHIEPEELQKLMFHECLIVMSEERLDVGRCNLTAEFSRINQQPCMMVHAQTLGFTDTITFGITLTAYLNVDLEVLQEDYYEYVKHDEGYGEEVKYKMVQQNGQMQVKKTTTIDTEVKEETASFSMSAIRGLITEGSHIIMMRLMGLRKEVPEDVLFLSLDQELKVTNSSFTSQGFREMDVDGEVMEVLGVQRTIHSGTTKWQTFILGNGHLATQTRVGPPVPVRLLRIPPMPKILKQTALMWEEDMQLYSMFLDRKAELKAEHASYLRYCPEIRALIANFLQFMLIRKPENVVTFARDYFHPFTPDLPPEPDS